MTGNWMPNDLIWPTILLDNPQNFQLGELEAMRHAIRMLRDNFSRLRTTDRIDKNVEKAFVGFSNDPFKWIFPSAENRYQYGLDGLRDYALNLATEKNSKTQSHFYPRSDNLVDFLKQFLSLLSGVSNRLANAPRDRDTRLSEETAGDTTITGEKRIIHATPWSEIDDNFYFARGTLYVLRHLMVATKHDFRQVLENKKSMELVDAIIETLDRTQFDPIFIANGGLGSLVANHSLQLQALLEDSRQKMRSLQSILEQ